MSLLFQSANAQQAELAQQIFDLQFKRDKKIKNEYDDYRKKMMLRDIEYSLEFLDTSMRHQSKSIFEDYALWIVKFLIARMQDLHVTRVKQHMVAHYQSTKEVLHQEYPEEKNKLAFYHLDHAIRITEETKVNPVVDDHYETGIYGRYRQKYLGCLLNNDKHGAQKTIDEAIESGISLKEVYMEIFQKVMMKVGTLWHTGSITVAEEHDCTAVTQSIMIHLWPMLYSQPRIQRTMIACCIGNELHEMGLRILCDILEFYGWDTIYLGAAVPQESIIHSMLKHNPDMVALSVTIPLYLEQCRRTILAIRADDRFANVKVAVGGRAFHLASHLPQEWGVDISAADGIELAEWAKKEYNIE